jgi:serine/threonine protein kinase
LVDENLNIKIADFGFATEDAGLLESYKGTPVYMAPEIALGQKYTGYKADIFSAGVILFTLVRGIFPFMSSTADDQFYKHHLSKDYASYWAAVEGEGASKQFKDLIQIMLAHDPDERPSLEKLKAHPWMTLNSAKTDDQLKVSVAEIMMKQREDRRQEKEAKAASTGAKKKEYSRGDDEAEEKFLAEGNYTKAYNNNSLTEWATLLTASEMWEKIEECVMETGLGEPKRELEKKKFFISNEEKKLRFKVKFIFSDEEKILRV